MRASPAIVVQHVLNYTGKTENGEESLDLERYKFRPLFELLMQVRTSHSYTLSYRFRMLAVLRASNGRFSPNREVSCTIGCNEKNFSIHC